MNINYNKIGNQQELNSHIRDVGIYVNEYVVEINSLNDTMYMLVDKSIGYGQSLTESLKIMANQVQDLVILDGYSAKIINPFDNISYEVSNCVIDAESLSIRLANKTTKKENIHDISFKSNGKDVKVDRDGFVSGSKPVELNSTTTSLVADISISFNTNIDVSDIYLELEDDGTAYPKISEITCVLEDGRIITPIILNSNSKSYSIQSKNSHVRIQPTSCKQIYIKIIKDDSELNGSVDVYSLRLNKLEVGISESIDTGSVIFGPIKSESEILKIGAFYRHEDGIRAFASTDKADWIEISNINSLSDLSSILNINNISNDSISTDISKEFFVKFELTASKSIPLNSSTKYIVRNGSTQDGYIEIPYGDEYVVTNVFEDNNYKYGKPHALNGKISLMDKPFGIMGNNKLSLLSDDETCIFNDTQIKILTDYDKVLIEYFNGYTTREYAGNNINVYSVSSPVLKEVSKNTTTNCCLKVKIQSDIYTIKYNEEEWKIDLSNGFARSIDVFNLKCSANDHVDVYSSDMILVGSVQAITVNGVSIISLYDLFFTEIPDVNFNKYYPYGDLDNKYSITKGRIFAKSSKILNVQAFVQVDSKVQTKLLEGSKNKSIMLDRKYASRHSQADLDYAAFRNQAKLDHSNILPGSLSVNTSNSPIISIDTEVEFIDGKKEFDKFEKSKIIIKDKLSEIQAQGIKEDSDIVVFGEAALFTNRVYSGEDLIYAGDYLVTNGSILLPTDVYTSQYIQTEIVFDSATNNSASGLYSVDYKNGILYSKNKIHRGISISYLHSTLYASYDAVTKVRDDIFTDTGSSVVIFGSENSYFVETTLKNTSPQFINISPLLRDVEIRYTT